jgi:HD-GYP domain-containing protein (c-di-GMP phosphodiesterase class II)
MEELSLFHSPEFPIARYRDEFAKSAVKPVAIGNLTEFRPERAKLSLLLLDRMLWPADGDSVPPTEGTLTIGIGLADPSDDDRIYLHLPENPAPAVFLSAIRRARQHLLDGRRRGELEREVRERTDELATMNRIGIALSTVRDHDVLIEMILTKARELSRSDAGSIYLLETDANGQKLLRWKLAQNDSISVDFEEKVLNVTKKSLAGYVALTGETLVIDDAYRLPADVEYSINTTFDRETGYLTRSIVVFPMTNHEGDTIGVVQLLNRKKPGAPPKLSALTVPDYVVPFDEHTVMLMRSLAGQAAVAVENNFLYDSIERLFEGFVTASVTAIEQRDPTTSGHSFRVADLTVNLAKTVDRIDWGDFRDVRFTQDQIREMRYASLLHDFGKVGVREKVLVKEKKLYPLELDIIRQRFEYVMKSVEAEHQRKKLDFLMRSGFEGFEAFSRACDAEAQQVIEQLEADFALVVQSNEPSVLPEGEFEHLKKIADAAYIDLRGNTRPILLPYEMKTLSIRKGNLDQSERGEIESHVTHTFHFLSKIPWTKDLMNVPGIAYAHHEKLNGRGYPRALPREQIPVQSRMMTVSDIYDALTANDRPYKRAISTDRALDILKMEVKDGLLDNALVDLFIEAKIFEKAGVARR